MSHVCHALGSVYHRCNSAPEGFFWTLRTGRVEKLNLCRAGEEELRQTYKTAGQELKLEPRGKEAA